MLHFQTRHVCQLEQSQSLWVVVHIWGRYHRKLMYRRARDVFFLLIFSQQFAFVHQVQKQTATYFTVTSLSTHGRTSSQHAGNTWFTVFGSASHFHVSAEWANEEARLAARPPALEGIELFPLTSVTPGRWRWPEWCHAGTNPRSHVCWGWSGPAMVRKGQATLCWATILTAV